MQQQQAKGTDIVIQGRIVWGGVKASVKKIYGTQTPAIDPKTGKEIIEYAFGLAVPKINPQSNQHEVENFQKFWNSVHHEAAKLGYQQGAQNFHWKFEDGDGNKQDGSPYPIHSKGHYIIACKTRIPLKLMAWEGSAIKQITDEEIKCGDYVQVALNIEAHGNPNAGMYINPSYVARFAYGEAIVNMPDPKTVFGNAPPPMPFGASSTPVGGGMAPIGFQGSNGFNGPGTPGFNNPPAMGAPAGQQQAPASMGYQPHTAVLPEQFQQQPGTVPPMGNGGFPGNNGMQGMPGMGQAPQQPAMYNHGQPNGNFQQPQMPGQTMNPMGPWQPPQ